MVKGVSRRIVVVKSPDRKLFEEAIFILREDAAAGVTAEDIVSEACSVATGYVRRQMVTGWKKYTLPLAIAGGGVVLVAGCVIGLLI